MGGTGAKRGGDAVLVRPVRSEDEEGLRGMLSRLSPESIYLRFHAPYPRVPEWAVASFAAADRRDGGSVVAVAGGEILGHAMYVRTDGGHEAEFAIVVEDRWHARGWEGCSSPRSPRGPSKVASRPSPATFSGRIGTCSA